MAKKTVTTKSAEETQQVAADFVAEILSSSGGGVLRGKHHKKIFGDGAVAKVVCLWGDLGSGKTTFSQGVAKALGVKEIVNSPTFVVMKEYPLEMKNREANLYHIDCYRMRSIEEVLDLGWEEIIADKNNIILVEWPEKIEKILPSGRMDIRFSVIDYYERKIEFL